MTDRELMQQALEALKLYVDYEGATTSADKAITALRERLAQPEQETVMAEYKFQTYAAYKTDGEMKIGVVPEQEPVAYVRDENNLGYMFTAPQPQPRREWVGLTDEEHKQIQREHWPKDQPRAIEAKLREKNA